MEIVRDWKQWTRQKGGITADQRRGAQWNMKLFLTCKEMVCMLKEWTRLKRRSREREERFTMENDIVLILKALTGRQRKG